MKLKVGFSCFQPKLEQENISVLFNTSFTLTLDLIINHLYTRPSGKQPASGNIAGLVITKHTVSVMPSK